MLKDRHDAEGILAGARGCERSRGLQGLCGGKCRAVQKIRRRVFWCAAASSEIVEGTSRTRNVVLEFPDYAAALACYHSPEYQRAVALRSGCSEADIVVVEGYDGPQPSDG